MPFTQEQIDTLASSYALLEPRLDEVVSDFYDRLFRTAPSVRELFPNDLSGQKGHLAASLRLVAQHVANIDALAEPLRDMGARHVGYGTQEAHYPVVRDTLIASMAEFAGDAWNGDIDEAWTTALNTIAGFMIEGARASESGSQSQAA